jgi:hypothetical protein
MSIGVSSAAVDDRRRSVPASVARVARDYRTVAAAPDHEITANQSRWAACSASSAAVGIIPPTSPPNAAISLTSDDET